MTSTLRVSNSVVYSGNVREHKFMLLAAFITLEASLIDSFASVSAIHTALAQPFDACSAALVTFYVHKDT